MTLCVAVDATAVPGRLAGAGRYIVDLLGAVDADDVELHVFVKEADVDVFTPALPNAKLHPVAVSGRAARMAWGHSLLAGRVRELGADVFHGPHYTLPRGLPCPGVVTFHDPTFYTLPKLHERKKVLYFRRAARAGVRRAQRVIVPSRYAMRGAVDHAHAASDRVDVIPHGVDHEHLHPEGSPDAAQPYVLFVGTLEPRKDVPTLVAAYDRLEAPHDLVVVGQRGWGLEAIDAAIARSRKRDRIRVLGYVEQDEKVRLYQRASAFVYPSIAEGFGLPVLEALACGVPVVTTTGSATEEVAGTAALLVPPQDVGALCDAMSRVLTDRSLQAALRKRGPEHASSFTWPAAARATTDVWRRAGRTR